MAEEIKEIQLNEKIGEYVKKQKEGFKKMFGTDDVKLVGVTFHFLSQGDTMLSNVGIYADGFNPDKFEEV